MTQPTTPPTLSPGCVAIGPLLPLLAHGMLDDASAARVRSHLATCAACRADLALHDQVDGVLRRVYATPPATDGMPLGRRELLALTQADRQPSMPPTRARARAPHAWRRALAGLPAVAAVLLLALLARYIFGLGPHGIGPGPAPTTSVSPAAILPANLDIKSIATAGNEAVWAVGSTMPDPKCISGGCGTATTPYIQPVMLFLQAGRWERFLTLPALHRADYSWTLNGVSMATATEGWAVGGTVLPPNAEGFISGILLHDTQGQWTIASLSLGAQLTAVAMTSATDGWIIGADTNGSALVLHYAGGAWVPVHAAAFVGLRLTALAAPAPNQVWIAATDVSGAGGFDGNAPSIILHYDGASWTRQTNPSPHTWLQGLAMLSPSEGWAVGGGQYSSGSGGPSPTPAVARILHYHDGVWSVQASFSGAASFTSPTNWNSLTFNAVAMLSPSDGWAVGSGGLIAHYDGARWTPMPGPTGRDLNTIALPPGGIGWAAGSASALLAFRSGRWSVYPTVAP